MMIHCHQTYLTSYQLIELQLLKLMTDIETIGIFELVRQIH